MLRTLFTIFLLLAGTQVWAQASYISWYQTPGGTTYCGEFTNQGAFIVDVDHKACRSVSPTHSNWYRTSGGTVYCGEFTDKLFPVQDLNHNVCRKSHPTHYNWYQTLGGTTYCGEFTPRKWFIVDHGHDVCRSHVNGGNRGLHGSAADKPKIAITEINKNLQSPEGAQVLLSGDIPIPRNRGCGASQSTDLGIQCYVCQAQSSRNEMLYTKDSILGIGATEMIENRQEIRISLLDSDDLGQIRCLAKNKGTIEITTHEELKKVLELSGFKFKEPGPIVKKIGNQGSEQ